MKLYYGTTSSQCAQIKRSGLDSRGSELWLSCSYHVAKARALRESRNRHSKPVVAVCMLNPARENSGMLNFRRRGPMVAINGRMAPQRIIEFIQVKLASSHPVKTGVLTRSEVFKLLDSPSPKVRMMGVMMLSEQSNTSSFDWLCTRLEDPDPRVRLAVTMALRRMGSDTAELLGRMNPLQLRYTHNR